MQSIIPYNGFEMDLSAITVDSIRSGAGQTVVLVHSSASGAGQWRALVADLDQHYETIAVNLFGYGDTTQWNGLEVQTLDDQAKLVEMSITHKLDAICLVGHSFGGSVAMKAASRLGDRVVKLILIEPNPFNLLKHEGRIEAYEESLMIRGWVQDFGRKGEWQLAAEKFIDYWNGSGTWSSLSDKQKIKLVSLVRPNFYEWDAVLGDDTEIKEWYENLPRDTMVLLTQNTRRPIQEIGGILQRYCRAWHFEYLEDCDHMAPLSRPDLVNPRVVSFLDAGRKKT